MTDIITRDFINKEITFFDFKKNRMYDYDILSSEIDLYKNILIKHANGDTLNKSIIIGIPPSIDQTACIFACFELGINICIIDYTRSDDFNKYEYIDPKSELLLPIDFFVVLYARQLSENKFNYFNKICNNTIIVESLTELDYSKNKKIFIDPDTIIMRCTSSGTTGTPKIIKHSHRFMANLAIRNSMFYDKSVGLTNNLNHGSSFATFFLPAIYSAAVKNFYNGSHHFDDEQNLTFLETVDHIMIPYSHQVSQYSKTNFSRNKIIYTLSSISSAHIEAFNNKCFKDLISFFGCNETSGPLLLNKTSSNPASTERYYEIDDFYKLVLDNSELCVSVPYYDNKVINTKDKFVKTELNEFLFLGRDDLKRINGFLIQDKLYSSIIKSEKLKNFVLVYDYSENKIYLAIDFNETFIDDSIKNIRLKIKGWSMNRHTIDKFAVVHIKEFMSGVKIDNELLRYYFRRHIE